MRWGGESKTLRLLIIFKFKFEPLWGADIIADTYSALALAGEIGVTKQSNPKFFNFIVSRYL